MLPVIMSPKKASGCGCSSVPISLIIVILGGGYWWFIHLGNLKNMIKFLPSIPQIATPRITPAPSKPEPIAKLPQTQTVATPTPTPTITTTPQSHSVPMWVRMLLVVLPE